MRRLLVFQHVPFEILGIFHPMLKDAGFRIRYCNFARHPDARPRVEDYSGLVVLGGPMNADQYDAFPHLQWEVGAIARAVEAGMPVLGICLGAQLIARAFGAKVNRRRALEIGWYDVAPSVDAADDPVLGALAASQPLFQWHEDMLDLPDDAVHLASSAICENQAFRIGNNVYGFQFHLEVDQPLIERWLNVPVHRAELSDLRGQIDANVIRQETSLYIDRSRALGEAVFSRFIDVFDLPARKRMLPTR
jgi:GMP synthase (glutamine-hydrolysing)